MNLARGDKLFYIYSKAIKTYFFQLSHIVKTTFDNKISDDLRKSNVTFTI